MSDAEHGSIEREMEIAATPETVFEVITSPVHLREWWPDDADLEATPGAIGHLVFGDETSPRGHVPEITVVDARPPVHFSFRWVYPDGTTARAGNSLLVEFDLTRTEAGTLLRMRESGFRERGWEAALLEEEYRDHCHGWDHFLPRLVAYAPTVSAAA